MTESMKTLDALRAAHADYSKAGQLEMAAVAMRRMRAEGRRLAAASGGELGWCSHHNELHPAFLFPRNKQTATGLGSYCSVAFSERRAGAAPEPPPKAPPPVTRTAEPRPRKCRKCKTPWIPAEGDKKERCPVCRGGGKS